MSHLIFYTKGLGPDASLDLVRSTTPTGSVGLSNSTFEPLWDALGFNKRKFQNAGDPSDQMETYYMTTIHDKEPVGIHTYELSDMLDNLSQEQMAEWQDYTEQLYNLVDDATKDGEEFIFIF
jgi:hypothetical protein